MRVLMCPPIHYSIRYEINPWMKLRNRINPWVARAQWDHLHRVLSDLKVEIVEITQQPDCPDMVFTANAGVARGKTFIPSHFRFKERQAEQSAFIRFFQRRGYRIADVAQGMYFEGEGDLLPYQDLLFGGFRFRSEVRAHEQVATFLKKRLIGLELLEPHFYHLDTCFFPLDRRSVIYYPKAFDAYGRRAIEQFVENPIAVDARDAKAFACNGIVIGETVVVNQASRRLKNRLKKEGYHVVETPMSEFIKAGGSVKCLLLKL